MIAPNVHLIEGIGTGAGTVQVQRRGLRPGYVRGASGVRLRCARDNVQVWMCFQVRMQI